MNIRNKKMQSKKSSFIEANINTFSGFVVSMILAYTILPYFGVQQSFNTSLKITLIFTFASLMRNYLIRRLFNAISHANKSR